MNAKNLSLAVAILSFVGGSTAALNAIVHGLPFENTAAAVIQVACGLAGYLGAIVGVVVAWMTRQEGQVQAVLAKADQPEVQEALLRRVAQYPGVKAIDTDPVRANEVVNKLAADSSAPKIN